MHPSSPRRLYTVALATGLLFVIGVATAAWLASGTGSGYARAGTAQALTTLDASASAVGDLYPGGSGDLHLTITNPNPYPVTVTSVTGSGTITSDTTGCAAPDHGVTFTDQTGLSLAVPASSSADHVLAGAIAMAATSPDACAGAVFEIPVSLSGVSGEGSTSGGTTFVYYADMDSDGYGSETQVESTSGTAPANTSAQSGDCDDTRASVNPGATPVPGDGIDNDCDGSLAEGSANDCDDADDATVDSYDPGSDTCNNSYYPAGTACDDGDPATTNDTWDGAGTCSGVAT